MVTSLEQRDAEQRQAALAIRPVALGRRRSGRSGFAGNAEPALSDLMADPILHRLLASDGVQAVELLALIFEMRAKLLRP